MSSKSTATLRSVDAELAKMLRRLRLLVRSANWKKVPDTRSMQPGPNLLRHMSAGLLAGEAVRIWTDREVVDTSPLSQLAQELRDRGFEQSSLALQDNDDSQPVNAMVLDTIVRAGTSLDTKLHLISTTVDDLTAQVDTFDPRPLSHKEVVEDLTAINAPSEAIDAYVTALGTSDISPTEVLNEEAEAANDYNLEQQSSHSMQIVTAREHEITL